MKQFFSILFVAFALSLTASAQETIDLQVNGVGMHATEATVVQKLGKPSSRKKGGIVPCHDGETLLTWRYPGLALEFSENLEGKFTVFTATVTSPKWSVLGINIGASVGDVRRKFGDGKLTKEKGLNYLSYYITDGYANFVFKKNKLIKIDWEVNMC